MTDTTPEKRWQKTVELQKQCQREVDELWSGVRRGNVYCKVGVHDVALAEMPLVFDGATLAENGGGFHLADDGATLYCGAHRAGPLSGGFVRECKRGWPCHRPIVSDDAPDDLQEYARAVGVPVMAIDGDTICPRCALKKKREEPEVVEGDVVGTGCPGCGNWAYHMPDCSKPEAICPACRDEGADVQAKDYCARCMVGDDSHVHTAATEAEPATTEADEEYPKGTCPECGATDITENDDGVNWERTCVGCGHRWQGLADELVPPLLTHDEAKAARATTPAEGE